MKSEVYSWRVSKALKEALEAEARASDVSLARLLEQISEEWLESRRREQAARQNEIREAAARYVGGIAGGNPNRSEEVTAAVRARLAKDDENTG